MAIEGDYPKPKSGKKKPPKGDNFGSEDLLAELEERARRERELLALDAIMPPEVKGANSGIPEDNNKKGREVVESDADNVEENTHSSQDERQYEPLLTEEQIDEIFARSNRPSKSNAPKADFKETDEKGIPGSPQPEEVMVIPETDEVKTENGKSVSSDPLSQELADTHSFLEPKPELDSGKPIYEGYVSSKSLGGTEELKPKAEGKDPQAIEPALTPENPEPENISDQNERALNVGEKADIEDARRKIEATEDKETNEETEESELVRVVAVDMTETANKVAYSNAKEILAEQEKEVGGFRGTFRKAMRPARFKKIFDAELDRIHEKGFNDHDRVIAATVNRLGKIENEENLHGDEKRRKLEKSPEDITATEAVKSLIREFTKGEMTKDEFLEKKDKLLRYELADGAASDVMDKTNYKKQKMFADNLLDVAINAREQVKNGEKPNLNLEIVVGRAGEATGTEVKLGWVEKQLKRIDDHPLGYLVTTGTIGAAMAIVYSAAVFGSDRGARIMAKGGTLGLGGGAAVAGVIEGARASKDFKTELAIYKKQRALGEGEINPEMEALILETKNAYDLLDNLDKKSFGGSPDKQGNYPKRELSEDPEIREQEIKEMIDALVEVEARIALRDRMRIDLFSVSKDENLYEALDDIDEARAMAKLDLQGYDKEGQLIEGESVMKFFLRAREDRINSLLSGSEEGEDGILAVQKREDKEARSVAWKAGKRAALYTGLMGAGLQEVVSTFFGNLSGLRDFVQGNREIQSDGAVHNTPLAELANYLSGNKSFDTLQSQAIEGGYNADISYGSEIVKVGDHYELMSGTNSLGEVNFNPDGTISDETIQRLGDKGVVISSELQDVTTTETVKGDSLEDWKKANPEMTQEISRTWMDNNTSGTYEKNELRFDMQKDGNNAVLDVTRMFSDGSYHGGTVEDMPEEIKSGDAKILISPTDGSQGEPIVLSVGPDGKVAIPLDSDLGKNLFEVNGKDINYNGSTIEAAIDKGLDENGKEHMHVTATIVGENNLKGFEFANEVEKTSQVAVNTIEVPIETKVDVPPPIPIIPEKRKARREQEEAASGGVFDETVGETDETVATVGGSAMSEGETAETPAKVWDDEAIKELNERIKPGSQCNVERSNGDLEKDWKFVTVTTLSKSGEPYLLMSKNNTDITKEVLLSKFLDLNPNFRDGSTTAQTPDNKQAIPTQETETGKTTKEQADALIERLKSLDNRTGLSDEFRELLEDAYRIGIIVRPNKTNNIEPKKRNKELGERFLDSLSKLEIVATHPHRNRTELMNNANMMIEHLKTAGEDRKNPGLAKSVQEALDLAFERNMIGRRKGGAIFGKNKAGERFIEALLPNEIEFINTGKNAKAATPKGDKKKEGEEKKGDKAAEKKAEAEKNPSPEPTTELTEEEAREEIRAELRPFLRQEYEKALVTSGSVDQKRSALAKLHDNEREYAAPFEKKYPSYFSAADIAELVAASMHSLDEEFIAMVDAEAAELEAKKAAKEELPTFHDPAPTEAPAIAATEGKSPEAEKSWSLDNNPESVISGIRNSMLAEGMTADEWAPYAKKLIPNIAKNSKDGVITDTGIEEVARGLRLNTEDQKRFVSAMKSALGEPK